MPLTDFQAEIARLLAKNRSPESHLAGGSALHFKPHSLRYSQDLDYFHDKVELVAEAFSKDEKVLRENHYDVQLEMNQSGYIRTKVSKASQSTKIEWSHDTAWRFMPAILNIDFGYMLHPVDLAINKTLALVGRDEPRDFLDVLHAHKKILPLGALLWACAGKDPGYTPLLLLELLKRRGKYRPEDFTKLKLLKPVNIQNMKSEWLSLLDKAESFIENRSPDEIGCLYYSRKQKIFFAPSPGDSKKTYVLHYGRKGGILPYLGIE
ncbi:MAG: hypothetical protein KDD48_09320 [Bdellovibrionales bacterium]|nr:hypothetical protein [Bdellovibrionales bacterium]